MRNTDVKATIKVNGKHQILGTCSPQMPESINLKFALHDYVGHENLPAKKSTDRHSRVGTAKGWNIMFKNGFFFLFFILFCQALENTLWEYHHIFLHWTSFGGDWFPRGSQYSSLIFSPSNPQKNTNFWPTYGLWKITLKMLNNGDAHLQTTLNRHRSPTKVA